MVDLGDGAGLGVEDSRPDAEGRGAGVAREVLCGSAGGLESWARIGSMLDRPIGKAVS